jgi:methylmalonyl-CoA mutase N-terminal domain/subunit
MTKSRIQVPAESGVTQDSPTRSHVSDNLQRAFDDWSRQHLAPVAEGAPGRTTRSGIDVERVYTPLDVPGAGASDQHLEQIGLPGAFPFTRGIDAAGYRREPWVMGMYSGRASPSVTNQRIRDLLASGQRGFSIALDLPTQNGLDSDHPLAEGEVGRVGVPIDTIDDMAELLDGIELDKVSQIRTTANAIGPLAVAMFAAAAELNGYPPDSFRVLLQNDVLKEYLARGTYIFPPRAGVEFSVDVIEYCTRHLPNWESIEFCGYHVRDSGSSAVQELAVAFSNGRAYIDAALRRGLTIDEFAPGIYLFLAAHIDILEEVAKFRAARRIWAHMMRDEYGSTNDASCAAKLFVYTLGSVQTFQEPYNNIVRIAYQALAAALGGVQTLATSSWDEAMRLPSEQAALLGLRTQQILAYETGITSTIDPLGGSYAIERLTDELEAATWREMARIDEQGGAIEALESGWLRREIDDQAYRTQLQIERGELAVVGVNKFAQADGEGAVDDGFEDGPDVADFEAEQRERLAIVKSKRDAERVETALSDVTAAARGRQNTVPTIIAAVHAHATVGEICSALASVWGRATTGATR